MSEPPRVKPREVMHALLRAGFVEVASKGSHRQFRRPQGGGRVTVPVHEGRDVPPGTLRSILRQAGLTAEEFTALQ